MRPGTNEALWLVIGLVFALLAVMAAAWGYAGCVTR
jgi:hypothetical protein